MHFNNAHIITLKKNSDFKHVYRVGKSFVSPYLVTYVLKRKKSEFRFGITASKKTGCAVLRNRSRRIIMASIRSLFPLISDGYDVVFVARGKTPYVKSYDILKYMKIHLKKANVIKS